MTENDLTQSVVDLHDIARKIEQVFGGPGKISIDVRNCADRLNVAIKPIKVETELAKGDY